jgi:hypothetical protein
MTVVFFSFQHTWTFGNYVKHVIVVLYVVGVSFFSSFVVSNYLMIAVKVVVSKSPPVVGLFFVFVYFYYISLIL